MTSAGKLSRAVSWLAALLVLEGVAFVVASVLTPVDRQQVTTGAIVVYAGMAMFAAAATTLVGLVLVLIAFLRRTPARWRMLGSLCAGTLLFGSCILLAGKWIATRLA